ncbi:MAG: hypothetical protein ABSA46_00755 [Thermodesulfovibrionales bacterium]
MYNVNVRHRCFYKYKGWTFFLLVLLFFLHACASTKAPSGFSSGDQKNSLPLMEKTSIEEIHSIVVAPFYGDDTGWQAITAEVIASSARVSVVSVDKMDSKVRDISAFMPEDRLDLLGGLGKSLQADAVLQGVILNKEQSHELILQLISSKDSRILWWQAVDIRFRAGSSPSASDQKTVLLKMLDPLIFHMGTKEKPVLPAATAQEPGKEGNPAADSLRQKEPLPNDEQENPPTKPKTDKKPKKTPKPTPPEEDFNPM